MSHFVAPAALVDTEIDVSDGDLAQLGIEKGMMTLADEARQSEIKAHLAELLKQRTTPAAAQGFSVIAASQFGELTYMRAALYRTTKTVTSISLTSRHRSLAWISARATRWHDWEVPVLISPDAERSMNTFCVSETLSITEVNEDAIASSDWVYLEGYLVTSPQVAALKLETLREPAAQKVAVSFSDPGMVTFFRDNMNQMMMEVSTSFSVTKFSARLG